MAIKPTNADPATCLHIRTCRGSKSKRTAFPLIPDCRNRVGTMFGFPGLSSAYWSSRGVAGRFSHRLAVYCPENTRCCTCACCCIILECFSSRGGHVRKTLMPAERRKRSWRRIRKDGRVLATDLAQDFKPPKTRFAVLCRSGSSGLMHACLWGPSMSPARFRASAKEELPIGSSLWGKRWLRWCESGQLLFIDAGSTNLAVPVPSRSLGATGLRMTRPSLCLRPDGPDAHHRRGRSSVIGAASTGQALRVILGMRPIFFS